MIWISAYIGKQLTKNFHSDEIAKASHFIGNGFEFDLNVVEIAQYVRTRLGVPVHVNSAYRNKEYNETIPNSATKSQHILGRALDITGNGVNAFMKNAYENKTSDWYHMVNLGLNGIGFYGSFVHIDTRQTDFAVWYDKTSTSTKSYGFAVMGAILVGLSFFGLK